MTEPTCPRSRVQSGTDRRLQPTRADRGQAQAVSTAVSTYECCRYSLTACSGTRNDRPTRTAGSSPPWTSRYTVIFDTRIIVATSATVRKRTSLNSPAMPHRPTDPLPSRSPPDRWPPSGNVLHPRGSWDASERPSERPVRTAEARVPHPLLPFALIMQSALISSRPTTDQRELHDQRERG